jgi:hypothetical protein
MRGIAPLLLCALAGCHLIFPFSIDEVLGADDVRTDFRADAAPDDPDGAGPPDGKGEQGTTTADVALPPPPLWSKPLGGSGGDIGWSVATDAQGNIYVGGGYSGTMTLGGQSHTSNGTMDAFIASFDAAGQHRWSRTFGGDGNSDSVYAVTVGPQGHIYLTGHFNGTASPGGKPLTSLAFSDIFVVSYTASGVPRWSLSGGGSGFESGTGITAVKDKVYITGTFSGSVDLGCGKINSNGYSDAFVASYGSAGGACKKSIALGSSESDQGRDVATDALGNVYVGGAMGGDLTLDSKPYKTKGASDLFLVALDGALGLRWFKLLGSPGNDLALAVATDSKHNVYLGGSVSGAVDLGGSTDLHNGGADIVLVSFSTSGAFRWVHLYGGPSTDAAYDLCLDAQDNLYVTGQISGAVKLGGGLVKPAVGGGAMDVVTASYTAAGGHRWSRAYGGAATDVGYGAAVNREARLVVTGSFVGSIDFGQGAIAGTGTTEGFLAQLPLTP